MPQKKLDIPSNPPVCFRVSTEEKERFRQAAERDGKKLGTWLRWLARQRAAQTEKTGRTD